MELLLIYCSSWFFLILKLCKKQLLIQLFEQKWGVSKLRDGRIRWLKLIFSRNVFTWCRKWHLWHPKQKTFFFQNLTQQVIRLCDTWTRCVENRPFFSFLVNLRSLPDGEITLFDLFFANFFYEIEHSEIRVPQPIWN